MIECARFITQDQPLPEERSSPRPEVQLYSWWRMPSGQVAELRRIEGSQHAEVVVRYLNENGEMGPAEHRHTLRFLVTRCARVRVKR